jgi:ankyrin
MVGWWMVPLLAVVGVAAASEPQLIEAVKRQDNVAVRALLARVDVNSRQPDGATALHWAVHRDDLEVADLLILSGANVNAANDLGVTPLFLACENRNAAMVERLLTAGANPNTAVSTGETVLMTAARTGSVDAVKALLARGADLNARETARGQTALMWAVAEGHPEVVRMLIESGADVHARSRVKQMTVSRGDPTKRQERSTAPRHVGDRYAGGIGEVDRGGSTALSFAARQGDLDAARLLLAADAHVNDTAPDGTSVLVVAAHSGHGALAAFLLNQGADPNADGAGYTALHAAVLRGDLDLVKALLAHGANPNVRLTQGTPVKRRGQDFVLPETLLGATPFLLAARFLEVGIMRVLAAGGADPALAMDDGTTALMAAAGIGWEDLGYSVDRRSRSAPAGSYPPDPEEESRTLEAVMVAAAQGVDVNTADPAGDTALHGAAARGFRTVIQLLVGKGAKLDVKNKRGQTPLAVALARAREGADERNSTAVADLLRQLGAQE